VYAHLLILASTATIVITNYSRSKCELAVGPGRACKWVQRAWVYSDSRGISTRLVEETSKCSRCCTSSTTWPTYEATHRV